MRNSFSGATSVSAGTLIVDGSQTTSVATVTSGGTLSGTGTLGTVNVSGGTLGPATPAGGTGTLTVNGNITFSSTADYTVTLNGNAPGAGYDQVNLTTGSVNLGSSSSLNVILGSGFTPTVGETFTIIQSPSAVSGSFASLPEGTIFSVGGQLFQVSYQNNDVTLTCIAATTTTVVSSLNPSTYGQSVTFTATIVNTSGSGGVPTGSVAFYDGSTELGLGTTPSGSGASATSTFTLTTLTAGTHSITADYVSTGDFQDSSSAILTQTVLAAALFITADNQTMVYGAALPTLTASYSGFVNGDTSASLTTQPTLSTTATAGSHVSGSPYTITASGAADSNYSISYVSGALSVTPAPLTITADNQAKVYGAGLPALTASYSGFVNGDTSASLATQPTVSTTATAASHVSGSPYTITASGAVDSDYSISYVAGA